MRRSLWALFTLVVCARSNAAGPAVAPGRLAPPAASSGTLGSETIASNTNLVPGTITLTLDESVRRAISEATAILKAKNTKHVTGTALLQAYAQFLPNLSASAGYTLQDGKQLYTISAPLLVNSRSRSESYQISSSLNLFDGLADVSALQSATKKNAAADLTLYRAKQQIALDVTQSYLQVLLDQDIVHINSENLHASRERGKLLEAQAQVGIRSLTDLYRQQAQTSADEAALVNAENRQRADLILLIRRLRLDVSKPYALASVPAETPPATDPYTNEGALMASALQLRADLRAQKELADSARWDLRVARGGYLPRLDLGATYNGAGRLLDRQIANGADNLPPTQRPFDTQLRDQTYYTVGATVSWDVFSRALTHLNVERARAVEDNERIDYEDLRNQVDGDVKQAVGDYRGAVQQLESSRQGLHAAQSAYDAVLGRYDVGAATFIDVLAAQSALVQAQAQRAQSEIGFLLQSKQMDFVLGKTSVSS